MIKIMFFCANIAFALSTFQIVAADTTPIKEEVQTRVKFQQECNIAKRVGTCGVIMFCIHKCLSIVTTWLNTINKKTIPATIIPRESDEHNNILLTDVLTENSKESVQKNESKHILGRVSTFADIQNGATKIYELGREYARTVTNENSGRLYGSEFPDIPVANTQLQEAPLFSFYWNKIRILKKEDMMNYVKTVENKVATLCKTFQHKWRTIERILEKNSSNPGRRPASNR